MQINKEKLVEELSSIGKIDTLNLMQDLAEHANKVAWYTYLYEVTKARKEKVKWELTVLESEIDLEIRSTSSDKVTEKMIERSIVRDVRYRQKYNEYLELKEMEALLKAFVDALAHKKDMLVSYTSLFREELKAHATFNVER